MCKFYFENGVNRFNFLKSFIPFILIGITFIPIGGKKIRKTYTYFMRIGIYNRVNINDLFWISIDPKLSKYLRKCHKSIIWSIYVFFSCTYRYQNKRLVFDEQSVADGYYMFAVRVHGEDRGAKTYGQPQTDGTEKCTHCI